MSRTKLIVIFTLAITLLLAAAAPVLRAQAGDRPRERDRRVRPDQPPQLVRGRPDGRPGDREEQRQRMRLFYEKRQMERLMRNLREGRPLDPGAQRSLERVIGTRLFRSPKMNPIDLAHYSIAEIYLREQKIDECLKRLQTVLDQYKDKENETAWVTHLNMAIIYRKLRGDIQQALDHFKKVKGLWAGFARQQLIQTYEETGQIEEAVALLKTSHEGVEEKGARLAMLRSIAELYERNRQPDKAIEYYNKITEEFTPEDIAKMINSIKEEVKRDAEQVIALRKERRFEEAERIMQRARNRLNSLRAQGRNEEAEAFEHALGQVRRSIERAGREPRPPRPREQPAEPPRPER